MSRRYAKLDDTTIDSKLETQQGGLIIVANTDATDTARNVRCTQNLTVSKWYWECTYWGTEDSIPVVFGLLPSAADNTKAPGTTSGYGAAYIPLSGECYFDGTLVGTIAPLLAKKTVGFALDMQSGTKTLSLVGPGQLVLFVWTLTGSSSWVPAASLGCAIAYETNALINFGLRDFENEVLAGYKEGIYSNYSQGGELYLGSDGYRLSSSDADRPDQLFEARIINAEKLTIGGEITTLADGSAGYNFSASDLDINNSDGKFSELVSNLPRDAIVELYTVDLDDDSVAPFRCGTALVESAVEPSDSVVRLTLGDPLQLYKTPLQHKTIQPWYDAGVANSPYPIALGALRNAPTLLVNATDNGGDYVVGDAPLTEINVVRDKGDPLDPTADPPDWWVRAGQNGFICEAPPVGLVQCDVSSGGTNSLTPVDPTDLVNGVGTVTTETDGFPTDWINYGSTLFFPGTNTFGYSSDHGGCFKMSLDTFGGSGGTYIQLDGAFGVPVYSGTPLVAGKRYKVTVDIVDGFMGVNPAGDAPFFVRVNILRDHGGAPQELGMIADVSARTVSFVFTALDSGLIYCDCRMVYDTAVAFPHAGLPWFIELNNFRVFELPTPLAVDPLTLPLDGITLTEYEAEIARRAKIPDDMWSSDDTTEIDTVLPYKIGVYIGDAVDKMAGIQAPLDTFGATTCPDKYGVIRFPYLRDPDTIDPSEIVVTFLRNVNLVAMPLGTFDPAPGISTVGGARYNWRKSGSSDFVDDLSSVTGIDAETRTRFQRDSQYIVQSNVRPHDNYNFAIDGKAIPYLVDVVSWAQALTNRLNSMFVPSRTHYKWTGYIDPLSGPEIRCGIAVRVMWDQLGELDRDGGVFATGKNLIVKGFNYTLMTGQVDITKGWT